MPCPYEDGVLKQTLRNGDGNLPSITNYQSYDRCMPGLDALRRNGAPLSRSGFVESQPQGEWNSSTVLYPNLWFAQEIGIYNYKIISEGLAAYFVGEWTFSGVAFPNFEPNHSDYFRTIPNIKEDTIKELWRVREKAAAFIERIAQSILDLQPRIVGCSSTFHQNCASLALLRRIRELAPEVMTVMGGANCEGAMGLATHQAFPWVDFVCSGEGDEIFAQLCGKLLKRGRDWT
jgi:magnesium-protoporphyrin IX monomethyl ester (oxidative) cyclase